MKQIEPLKVVSMILDAKECEQWERDGNHKRAFMVVGVYQR
jgi:hypothetical protein